MKRVLYVHGNSCNENGLRLVLNKTVGLIDLSTTDLNYYSVRGKNYQNDLDIINTIRYNGKKKLHMGYDLQKSANQLVSYINGL